MTKNTVFAESTSTYFRKIFLKKIQWHGFILLKLWVSFAVGWTIFMSPRSLVLI
ncbi:conserved hypothetical protein [Photobacterium leiognathi lrivu.4.1]|uniref:Uncharacterized protein n=1 Tax=Photobacterium leiognathi lrivu.4.1 TaxID=1248232 RepID=V5F7L4_PHOLE|nr:conserved hypothetical protein [Photobacterium leiognathi lrivu.4.1]